jgi:hypothetical protein
VWTARRRVSPALGMPVKRGRRMNECKRSLGNRPHPDSYYQIPVAMPFKRATQGRLYDIADGRTHALVQKRGFRTDVAWFSSAESPVERGGRPGSSARRSACRRTPKT